MHVSTAKRDEEIRSAIKSQGVNVALLSDYCAQPSAKHAHNIVINFASIPPYGIEAAVKLLEEVFQEEILKK